MVELSKWKMLRAGEVAQIMPRVLEYILLYFEFLWNGRYRITDSRVSTGFGGQAEVIVSSDLLAFQFLCDKTDLLLRLGPAFPTEPPHWYNVDLVQRIFTGQIGLPTAASREYADFVRTHLAEIEEKFGNPDAWQETKALLEIEMNKRVREFYGKHRDQLPNEERRKSDRSWD